jgi:hypothetical protein
MGGGRRFIKDGVVRKVRNICVHPNTSKILPLSVLQYVFSFSSLLNRLVVFYRLRRSRARILF